MKIIGITITLFIIVLGILLLIIPSNPIVKIMLLILTLIWLIMGIAALVLYGPGIFMYMYNWIKESPISKILNTIGIIILVLVILFAVQSCPQNNGPFDIPGP
jgi:hypothetical protein